MSSENCARVRELIPESVINRLGEDELGLVESHISDCFSSVSYTHLTLTTKA